MIEGCRVKGRSTEGIVDDTEKETSVFVGTFCYRKFVGP